MYSLVVVPICTYVQRNTYLAHTPHYSSGSDRASNEQGMPCKISPLLIVEAIRLDPRYNTRTLSLHGTHYTPSFPLPMCLHNTYTLKLSLFVNSLLENIRQHIAIGVTVLQPGAGLFVSKLGLSMQISPPWVVGAGQNVKLNLT